jgi:hypothetical protein
MSEKLLIRGPLTSEVEFDPMLFAKSITYEMVMEKARGGIYKQLSPNCTNCPSRLIDARILTHNIRSPSRATARVVASCSALTCGVEVPNHAACELPVMGKYIPKTILEEIW